MVETNMSLMTYREIDLEKNLANEEIVAETTTRGSKARSLPDSLLPQLNSFRSCKPLRDLPGRTHKKAI